MEERRKQMTGKRPYRCHVCGYRSWFDETSLRYPASAQKPLAPGVAGTDVPVPDLQLDENHRDTGLPDMTEAMPVLAPNGKKKDAPRTDVPLQARTDADREPDADLETETDADSEAKDETLVPPPFDPESGRLVSSKVSPAFHHHARNKSRACPACGEYALYRSRARNLGESLRKKLGTSRPFRCHSCGWRGWMKRR